MKADLESFLDMTRAKQIDLLEDLAFWLLEDLRFKECCARELELAAELYNSCVELRRELTEPRLTEGGVN
jgi:hypothetical protein